MLLILKLSLQIVVIIKTSREEGIKEDIKAISIILIATGNAILIL